MSILSNPFTSKRQQLDDLQREYDNLLNSYKASKASHAQIAASTISGATISAGTIPAGRTLPSLEEMLDETTWIGITPVENGYLVKADAKTFVASTFDDVQKTIATVMVQMKLATSD